MPRIWIRENSRNYVVAIVAIAIWFICFPDDGDAIISRFASLLELSRSLSPWLYLLAAVGLVCWTARSCLVREDPQSKL